MGMEQSISGPALGIPVQIIDEQLRRAVIGCVIRMSNNEVIIDILMSGTFPHCIPAVHNRAAAIHHAGTVFVHVWTCYAGGTAVSDFVGAVDPLAAGIEGGEQIIVTVSINDGRRFNGPSVVRA